MARIGNKIRSFRSNVRGIGLLYALQGSLSRRVPQRLFSVNSSYVFEGQPDDWADSDKMDPDMRWATPDDLPLLDATGLDLQIFRDRFARGAFTAIFVRDGKVISYYCLEDGSHNLHDWLRYRLSPREIWVVDVWVAPEHRGQRIHGRIYALTNRTLVQGHYDRELSTVNALNRNSMRATLRAGHRIIGRIFYVRILGLTFVRAGRITRLGFWGPKALLDLPADVFD